MADHYFNIGVETLKLPSSNAARIDGGQNNFYALFDDTTSQSGRKQFELPANYVSDPRLRLLFTLADTQVGTLTVKWSISVMAVTPDDAVDIETDSFDTVNTGTKTLALNEVAGVLKALEIDLTNFDNGVAGDLIILKIALDVSGTASGDVELTTLQFVYADA
jgi:hypothetical protein